MKVHRVIFCKLYCLRSTVMVNLFPRGTLQYLSGFGALLGINLHPCVLWSMLCVNISVGFLS